MNKGKKVTIWTRGFTCAILANLLLAFSQQTVTPLITTYAKFLGAGAVLTGLMTGLYFAVAVAIRPVSGPVITKIDKRKIMIFTFSLGVATSIGYALCRNIAMFVAIRLIHGIQFAFVGSLSLTIIGDSVPKEKLGMGIGMLGVGMALSSAVGPNMGLGVYNWAAGLWSESAGYTAVFLLSAIIIFLALIPALLMPSYKPDPETLKALGSWYKNIVAKEALIPRLLMLLFTITTTMFPAYILPFSREKGIENIGLYFTVNAIVLLASRPLSGKLIDKIGIGKVYLPSTVLYLAAIAMIGFTDKLWVVLAAGALQALGFGTLNPAVMALTVRCVPPEKRGVASNTVFIGMDSGNFLGPFLGGVAYKYVGYSNMFLLGSIPFILAAVVFFLSWRNMRERLY